MRKKDISRILRQARDLMNDSGKHWIKGMLRDYKREASFCSVGAVNRASGRANGNRAYQLDNRNREALYALANEIRKLYDEPPFKEFTEQNDLDVTDIITEHNDDASHVWKDIRDVFTRAAKNPVIPKS